MNRSSTIFALFLALFGCLAACGGSDPSQNPGANDDGGAPGTMMTGDDGGGPQACTPRTCAASSANCGRIPDGCKGTEECGTCGANETCGGAGTANVCGVGTCTPRSCTAQAKNCGTISDGCADVLDCGTCGPGTTCGGGGANVCGTGTCVPKTCASLGKNCGVVSDGCGASLSCGVCSGGAQCGAGGTANVCAMPCAEGCPMGYTCGGGGVCEGGNPGALTLDMKTVAVGGTITLNGADPMTGASCPANPASSKAAVLFTEPTLGYSFTFAIPCSTTGFTFTGSVFPGTYNISVEGYNGANWSNLPNTYYLTKTLPITAASPSIVLDVKTVAVGGSITMNGADPVTGVSCPANPASSKAAVLFSEPTLGYQFTFAIPCSTAGFTFTGSLFPGTYKISVEGYNGVNWSNLPNTYYLAKTLPITTANPNIVLDMKTVAVGGSITLNGASPTTGVSCAANPASSKAAVLFSEPTLGYQFTFAIPCSTAGFTWTGSIFPGTYNISIEGYNGVNWSNLPNTYYLAKSLPISAANPSIVLDMKTVAVGGSITLNGTDPVTGVSCAANPASSKAAVLFSEPTLGYQFTFAIPCSTAGFTFTGSIFPGTYNISIEGYNGVNWSNLPNTYYLAKNQTITAASPSIVLDMKTLAVGGSITLNGASPITGVSCAANPASSKAAVLFSEPTLGYQFTFAIPCSTSGFTFTGSVFPGTYNISIEGYNGVNWSNLPNTYYLAKTLPITAANPSIVVDMKTVAVGGTITLNGGGPMTGVSCAANPSSSKAAVLFDEPTLGYSFTFAIPCSTSGFTFTGSVFPGTYNISVEGYNGVNWSNLPNTYYIAADRVAIP